MDNQALTEAIATLIRRLVELSASDAELRGRLRHLAEAVLDATRDGDATRAAQSDAPTHERPPAEPHVVPQAGVSFELPIAASPDGARDAPPAPAFASPVPPSPPLPPPPPEPLPELTLGRASVVEDRPPSVSYPARFAAPTDDDLHWMEKRCRLKAEGARWAAMRRRRLAEGASFSTEIDPHDRDIIARAKEVPDCFLWMCTPQGPAPEDLGLFEHVAGYFDAVADVLSLLKGILDDPEPHQSEFEQALDLLAEAQSGLRVAIANLDASADPDQLRAFNWLKATAADQQIFIRRYMRMDDRADPTGWGDLSARIEALESQLEESRRSTRQRRKLLGNVRYKLSQIESDPEGAPAHWERLAALVDELVEGGLPPSHRELREMLLPVIDYVPEIGELPRGFRLVSNEIDRFIATSPAPPTRSPTPPSAEVQHVSRLLAGKSLVLIGGDRRAEAYQALVASFGLKDLIWIETKEHQSVTTFEPYIARDNVALVLLAIRWSSHSYGEVREFCDQYGKPLVRLPGGYNPNQVAAQIMGQASERLTGA